MRRIISGIHVLITVTVILLLTACGTATEGSGSSVSEVAEQTLTVNDTLEENEEDLLSDSEEEAFYVSAEDVISVIETQAASHTQIPKEEILAVVLAINYDDLEDEVKNDVMKNYAVSYEDLADYFNQYTVHSTEALDATIAYNLGDDTLPGKNDYHNWINYVDIVFDQEKKDYCKRVDENMLTQFIMAEEYEPTNYFELTIYNIYYNSWDDIRRDTVFEQQLSAN